MSEKLVEIRNLQTHYFTEDGVVKAVDGVDLYIKRGETLGVVGESGCGKSVTSLSIMRLIPNPPGKIVAGEILFEGEDLLKKPEAEMRKIRGNDISMIFQEPMTSLNPVYTVGDQIAEAIELHQGLSHKDALEKAVEMLRLVGIPLPEQRVKEFPHQLSGGMRQRVMIAMALSCNPKLLIADEPTTALDVTIQAQILALLKKINRERHTAILLVSHDIGLAAEFCDRIAVMYAGRIVEVGPAWQVVAAPRHPYTRGLVGCLPVWGGRKGRLEPIPGSLPDLTQLPRGCAFADRCPHAAAECREGEVPLLQLAEGREVACIRAEEVMAG